ncbi:MAG: YjjG family noncanonical pyrimidine nucleotidase [Clostridia bacterium]|nr:YjjG family noncanonical pyrimidine nucleotidase [Clostridia bacterium]
MIRNVLFDLDDTLLDFKRSEAEAIRHTLREIGIEPTDEVVSLYSRINRSCWAKLETAEWTREEVLHNRFDMLFEALGVSGDARATQKLYEYRLSLGAYYIDGAKEMLDEIHGKYRLYLATNGIVNVQTRRLRDSGIEKYFEDIFVSEKIGYNKPDKRFFDYAFERIPDFVRDETVMVGDLLTSDIKGGINAGIKTVYFNPKGIKNDTGITPHYEIATYGELIKLLETL